MRAARRVFFPVFGLTAVLTIVAVYNWLDGKRTASESLLWGGLILVIWALFAAVNKKIKHDGQ